VSGGKGLVVGLECLLWKKFATLGDVLPVESPLVGRDEELRWSWGSERRCRLKLRRRRRGLIEREREMERTDLESSPEELSSISSSQAGVRGRVWLRVCWVSRQDIDTLMDSVDE
jgi:hypothetical protein